MEAKQWQELCEWAELNRGMYGTTSVKLHDWVVPPQDMNTLWRWMWIKLDASQRAKVLNIWMDYLSRHFRDSEDPTEALVQAIYKVVKS